MHFKYLQKLCFGLQYYNSNLFDGFFVGIVGASGVVSQNFWGRKLNFFLKDSCKYPTKRSSAQTFNFAPVFH